MQNLVVAVSVFCMPSASTYIGGPKNLGTLGSGDQHPLDVGVTDPLKHARSVPTCVTVRNLVAVGQTCCSLGIDTLRERRELLTAKFFKRQVLASSSLLHSLLPDRRDNDITSSLRNAKPFYSFRTRTNRFRKSFLPYCLDNYT